METLGTILLLILAGWLVIDSLRAHEAAVRIGTRVCTELGLQLLDQTVALDRMRLCWTMEGLRLRRVYRFEYSDDGESRHCGYLVLVGAQLDEPISFE